MIVRLEIQHSAIEGYALLVEDRGVDLDRGNEFASVRHCLQSAREGFSRDVSGAEVAFRGIVRGTYTVYQLRHEADEIAAHAVRTSNAIYSAGHEAGRTLSGR